MYQMTREMYQLANALGIELIDQSPAPALSNAKASPSDAIEIIRGIGLAMKEKAPDHRMSTVTVRLF
jgi:hypothetical protein